ncbi:hypothetical protein GCM10022403_018260 [Streptomyces coacervatus]|uniref:Uncharacterized protein n=1 Tax=Streptomyces coacervatus TaxID=647381 RepID=A0ABP7H719_9ACTN|nr:hypothetical protein [Streptomyces coacervatus]MDF2271554.1 hypothetical protein [Streptomyces coacervatus]
MTTAARRCRACDESITDPDDAVVVGYEAGNSGPAWEVWAHREHAARQPTKQGRELLQIMAWFLLKQALDS